MYLKIVVEVLVFWFGVCIYGCTTRTGQCTIVYYVFILSISNITVIYPVSAFSYNHLFENLKFPSSG